MQKYDIKDLLDEQKGYDISGLGDEERKPSNYTTTRQVLKTQQFPMNLLGAVLPEDPVELVGTGSSIAGAGAGAAIGSVFPVVGTATGAIVGGAFGAFGGEVAEDVIDDKDIDYINATKEAGISLGIDVATLGAGKVLKPVYFAGRRAMGFSPEETVKELTELSRRQLSNIQPGSPQSFQATQNLLEERNASLRVGQIPSVSGIMKFYDSVGSSGLMSSGMYDLNSVNANSAIEAAIGEISRREGSKRLLQDELGETILGIMSEGKKVVSKQYSQGLDEVVALVGNSRVDVSPIYKQLKSILKKGDIELTTKYHPDTVKALNSLLGELSNGIPKTRDIIGNVKIKTGRDSLTNSDTFKTVQGVVGTEEVPNDIAAMNLLEWEKKVSNMLYEKSNQLSPMYNRVVDRELAEINNALKSSIDRVMSTTGTDVYSKYRAVKANYGEGINALRPETIQGIVKTATKGDYMSLGKVLLPNEGNLSKFKDTWTSLRKAIAIIDNDQVAKLGFESKEDMLNTAKSSYLNKLFPDTVGGNDFDFTKYAKKMGSMTNEQLAQAKIVLGTDYPRFNQIRNTVVNASRQNSNDVGLLSLRTKEFQTLATLGLGMVGGVPGVAYLVAPVVMAKASLNPKNAAKFINIMGRKEGTEKSLKETSKRIDLFIAELMDTSVDLSSQTEEN